MLDLDFFLRLDSSRHETAAPASYKRRRRHTAKTEARKRSRLHARLKARAAKALLPSLLQANVRTLISKMDEPKTRVNTRREMRECCALIFTETWLSDSSPDSTLQLHTYSLHRGDRTSAAGKSGGGGVRVYVNNRWCVDVQVVHKRCSAEIKVQTLLSTEGVQHCVSAICLRSTAGAPCDCTRDTA